MAYFDEIHVIKIECGAYHSLLLDIDGNVHSFGYNGCGQLGFGQLVPFEQDRAFAPALIACFSEKRVKIQQIACGFQHNLALDTEGKVWSWGYNGEGQCGDVNRGYLLEPQRIKSLLSKQIEEIGCGGTHSFVRSEEDEWYLFGDDMFNECSLRETEGKDVIIPTCVNQVFEELSGGYQIERVHLGSLNTIFVARQRVNKCN